MKLENYCYKMTERLQKFLSASGIASRRHAEEMILAGRVKVNGKVIRTMGVKVDPAADKIDVDGKRVKLPDTKIYLALNKPKRYLTTRNDPRRRKTVYDLLPEEYRNKVWPVGRLDFNTEGLLIFTNDGELTQALTHPSKEHEKEYEVVLDREISEGKLEKITGGMELDGEITAPAKARVRENVVYLSIHEGKYRQIRRMFSVLGLSVRNLKRIRVGKLKLEDLATGAFKKIKREDVA